LLRTTGFVEWWSEAKTSGRWLLVASRKRMGAPTSCCDLRLEGATELSRLNGANISSCELRTFWWGIRALAARATLVPAGAQSIWVPPFECSEDEVDGTWSRASARDLGPRRSES